MGASSSSVPELVSNEYLRRFSSSDPVDSIDPLWNQLLSFSFLIPVNKEDSLLLEEATAGACKNIAINNCKTGNFGALIQNFLVRAAELKASAQSDDNIFTWQTYNALFIIRSLCKYFLEHLSEELLMQQFSAVPATHDGSLRKESTESLAEDLINSLVELLVDVPVVSFTYALHLEALNTLLVLLSIKMFQPQPPRRFILYQYMMQGKCSIHACLLMKALLRNYINQQKCPPELFREHSDGGSMLYNASVAVASGLFKVMTLGMMTKTQTEPEGQSSEMLLANQSLLFILVLANQCTGDRSLHNPYRQALFSFTNSQDPASNTSPTHSAATFKIDFSSLYKTLGSSLRDDQSTLLLYILIHQNPHMKAFMLSRTNIDQLVMPLVKILYHAQDGNSHHIYMALIIVLILTEDDVFNKAVHELVIKNVMWFKERAVKDISLGGLLILVLIRTIQYNITRMRDKYLHTNCLAALANMSSHFDGIHPYVAQRLVSLFSQLCKKHTKLIEQIKTSALKRGVSGADSGSESEQDYNQDLAVLEEVIRMVLEIINSCLTHAIDRNPHLIYTLLYQRDIFSQFRTHPAFQDITQNIDTVLSFFSSRLEKNGQNLTPQEVLDTIKQGMQTFRKDSLKKCPELKFKYVEEESPEEFFTPYVWSLVYHASNLHFNPARIVLFSLAET